MQIIIMQIGINCSSNQDFKFNDLDFSRLLKLVKKGSVYLRVHFVKLDFDNNHFYPFDHSKLESYL